MKFLFQYEIIGVFIRRITMVFEIFLYHFIRYISGTPNTITNCPKMSTPISFPQYREFFLNLTRCSPFQSLNNITYVCIFISLFIYVSSKEPLWCLTHVNEIVSRWNEFANLWERVINSLERVINRGNGLASSWGQIT